MKLFFCCIEIKPSTLFLTAAILDIINALVCLGLSFLTAIFYKKFDDPKARERVLNYGIMYGIFGAIFGFLSTYALIVFISKRTISSRPQVLYFTIKHIMYLLYFFVNLIVGFVTHGFMFFLYFFIILAVMWPSFLFYCWNKQLKDFAKGQDKDALTAEERT